MNRILTFCLAFGCLAALAQQPENRHANSIQEADQMINNYKFDQALALLDNPGDSLNIDALQRMGYCHFRMGSYGNAIGQFEKIISIDSMNTNALVQLGQLYARNNQLRNAYRCYQKLIQNDSLNSYYYKQYAIVASQASDVITSLSNFFQTIKLNPSDIEAHALLANALLEAEQYRVADSILTACSNVGRSPQLQLLLAKAQLGEEKYTEVIKTTGRLLEKGDTLMAYGRLMGISYFQLGQYDKVLPFMESMLKSGAKAEWIYYYMGVSYKQLNQPGKAIEFLNMAIEKGISDNISDYYTELATSYESMKDFKRAIMYYKAAYKSSKSDILLYHLARNYDVYYKEKTQAITYYKRYLNSDDTIKIAKEYTKYRLEALSVYR